MDPKRRGYVGRRIQHPGKSERRGTAQEGTRAVPNRHRGKFHSQLPKLVKVCGDQSGWMTRKADLGRDKLI